MFGPPQKPLCGPKKPEGTGCAMFVFGTAVKCLISSDMYFEKMCPDRCKNHGCGQKKKTDGTSSAMFGVGIAVKCCELND